MQNNILINFLGDIMLGERFEKFKRGVKTQIENNKIDPFEYCKKDFQSSALNVGNLECVVSTSSKKNYPFSEFMKISDDKLEFLINNNIKVVNIANNHIFDHGEKAFFETRKNLEKRGIKYFGFDDGTGIQKESLKINIKGKLFAFLGYDLSNSSLKEFKQKVDQISEIISNNNSNIDLLVLSLHWGYEYSDSPTSFMIKAAEKFFDNGVDILYGHHPHILQGITCFNGKIFAPSLGNFIFDDERKRNRLTGILNIKFNGTNKLEYSFKPHFINEKFQPIPNGTLYEKFQKLTDLLEENIKKTENSNFSFDSEIFESSKLGHINNKKRVRKEIIKNISNYVPFTYPIFKDKIINKRIKKIFK